MAQKPEMWNGQQPLGGSFAGALLLHAAIAGGLVAYAMFFSWNHHEWGDSAANAGAIQASMVSAIPLPQTHPPSDNVLATETPSPAPAPIIPKAAPIPEPEAIPIPVKAKPPVKVAEKPAPAPAKIKPVAPPKPNQATYGETAGLRVAMSSTQTRNGTVSIAVENGDFGSRFGWYVEVVKRKVAENWLTQEVDPAGFGRKVYITFRVNRDGSPSNVRIETPSGDASLDYSAEHALQRIDTFGPLPSGYTGSYLNVDYYFEPPARH